MDIWPLIRHCFETNDGALPGVGLEGLTAPQVVRIYAILRCLVDKPKAGTFKPGFCGVVNQQDVPLDEVRNAAVLIAEGTADPIHFLVQDVSYNGVPIPDLGVFVSNECFLLDYRMGPPWSRESVVAFFNLFVSLRESAPNSSFCFDSAFPDPHAFLEAWTRFTGQPYHYQPPQ